MSRRLHADEAAEREASEIAFRFMNSSDVVGDMSRAYGADLSAVRIHTDESAARKAEEAGTEAFSTGKDVFFGRGIFDRNDPAGRVVLAHELAHSLQQGVGGAEPGAVAQSAPEGAAQGFSLIKWFRGLFSKKPKMPRDVRNRKPEVNPEDNANPFDRAGLQGYMEEFNDEYIANLRGTSPGNRRMMLDRDVFPHREAPYRAGSAMLGRYGSDAAEYFGRLAGGGVSLGAIGRGLETRDLGGGENSLRYSDGLSQMSGDLLDMLGGYAASGTGREYFRMVADPLKEGFGEGPENAAMARNYVMGKVIGMGREKALSGLKRRYGPEAQNKKGPKVEYNSANDSVKGAFDLLAKMPELMEMPEQARRDLPEPVARLFEQYRQLIERLGANGAGG